ncbi:unnamed protein product [Lampetra planeri]
MLQSAQETVASPTLPPPPQSWLDVAGHLGWAPRVRHFTRSAQAAAAAADSQAEGCDWMAFRRRFEVAYISVRWTPGEALRAFPTALDNDSLATFFAIPEADRATLMHAYTKMAAIYDPPSNVHRRFCLR